MTPKVTWPGRIKWPDFKLRFSKIDIVPKAHRSDPKSLNLALYSKGIGVYNLYISDFLYRWPSVMSISWPHHYR